MSILKNNKVIAVGDVNTYHPPILSCMWSDHIINDIQWLRADTFSWQSGDVYKTVYDKLVEEYATGAEETEGSITFKRTTNGFKIATADYETAILDKYNTDGIAWYYILDTENKRFKLPRTKFGFEGLRSNVGDDIAESLPNHKHLTVKEGTGSTTLTSSNSIARYSAKDNGYNKADLAGISGTANIGLTSGSNNSVYKDNAPVQERATQMYLYFYVGEYAQTAIEQTAGLNSELFNGKLDINASGLSTQGKSYVSGLGMPTNKYINLTLGASATVYTAPDNGWINIVKKTSAAGQHVELGLSNSVRFRHTAYASGESCTTSLPVYKGQSFYVTYTAASDLTWFRFIYAKGSQ